MVLMKNHEQNYPTHDMELTAIVFTLKICATTYTANNLRCIQTTKV